MNQPETFNAQQAADPLTPGQVLADIAALRPDLRPVVAANPATYPSLLEWLAGLGEPSVDAALRARQDPSALGSVGHTGPLAVPPTGPGGLAGPAGPWSSPQPGYGAPSGPGVPPTGTYGVVPPFAGAPQASGQPYGYQPMGAPSGGGSGSRKALWIVLGVVGGVILLAVVAFLVIRGLVAAVTTGDYGSDPALDALYDQCADEDWAACDELFKESPLGSEYERFADTCGGRTDGGTYCVDEFDASAEGEGARAQDYGDDPELDVLWDACEAGDGQACDDLFSASPLGSEYEEFADTCGGRTEGGEYCAPATGSGTDAQAYGDDPALDALWDACEAGDGQACDDLYWEAPADSAYEDFGSTCGGREAAFTTCAP